MKKVILFIVGFLMSTMAYSQSVNYVSLNEVDPSIHKGHKSPPVIPTVSYDMQNLYVWSAYAIDMAQIVIRNDEGTVIYNVSTALPSSSYVIMLPQYVCENKYSIELIYGSHHWLGYF